MNFKKVILSMCLLFSFAALSAQDILNPRVLFLKDSALIPDSQEEQIAMVAEYLKNHPEVKDVLVVGFTAPGIPEEQSEKISKLRAEAVRDRLRTQYGVEASRLRAKGGGTVSYYDEPQYNEIVLFVAK